MNVIPSSQWWAIRYCTGCGEEIGLWREMGEHVGMEHQTNAAWKSFRIKVDVKVIETSKLNEKLFKLDFNLLSHPSISMLWKNLLL